MHRCNTFRVKNPLNTFWILTAASTFRWYSRLMLAPSCLLSTR